VTCDPFLALSARSGEKEDPPRKRREGEVRFRRTISPASRPTSPAPLRTLSARKSGQRGFRPQKWNVAVAVMTCSVRSPIEVLMPPEVALLAVLIQTKR
jgi:hypothetical protein